MILDGLGFRYLEDLKNTFLIRSGATGTFEKSQVQDRVRPGLGTDFILKVPVAPGRITNVFWGSSRYVNHPGSSHSVEMATSTDFRKIARIWPNLALGGDSFAW